MSVRRRVALVSLLAAMPSSVQPPAQPPAQIDYVFTDVAAELGLSVTSPPTSEKNFIIETIGNGAGFFDYDNDGDVDVVIARSSTLDRYERGGDPMVALYRNDGGRFVDVTDQAGLASKGWGVGLCMADYDNDGFQDLYLTAYGPNVLYRNGGDGTFTDVTGESRVGDERLSTNCAFGDYDRDGDVDLYVANYLALDEEGVPKPGETDSPYCRYMGAPVFCGPRGLPGENDILYRNEGDGSFSDAVSSAGIEEPGYYGFGVIFGDLDGDRWPDVYVANDSVPNLLFQNLRGGRFSEVGLLSGASVNERGLAQAGMGVAAGDYDGDLRMDLFVTNFARDTNTLYRNLGNLFFEDATAKSGLGNSSRQHLGWGAFFGDLDNDGHQDLFVTNGHIYPDIDARAIGQTYRQPKELYRNLGNARFREITREAGTDLVVPRPGRGTAYADFDNDGDLDILVTNLDEPPSLYRNDGGNRNAWSILTLVGTRSNRSAIGARVELEAGGRTQVREVRSGGSYLSNSDLRLHFGLGKSERIDRLRVLWPSGATGELRDLPANEFIVIREGDGLAMD